jgi:Xaa-Pro aminopeptidase
VALTDPNFFWGRYRGLAVRIEDDVIYHGSGNLEIITADAPKTIPDIERACTVT